MKIHNDMMIRTTKLVDLRGYEILQNESYLKRFYEKYLYRTR